MGMLAAGLPSTAYQSGQELHVAEQLSEADERSVLTAIPAYAVPLRKGDSKVKALTIVKPL